MVIGNESKIVISRSQDRSAFKNAGNYILSTHSFALVFSFPTSVSFKCLYILECAYIKSALRYTDNFTIMRYLIEIFIYVDQVARPI